MIIKTSVGIVQKVFEMFHMTDGWSNERIEVS